MAELENGLQQFLAYWFSGLMAGLEGIDEPARSHVLHECGKACARSYTAQVFREAQQISADLDAFLEHLSLRFPEAQYERLDSHTIQVTYNQCACDLVTLGLVTSPLLCECSAANLRENFEQALGTPASVTVESSILRGGPRCVLMVSLEDNSPDK
jgi:predicted ArsR family transcriptional regulator